MQTKIRLSVISGITATAAMTIFSVTSTAIGMPDINPAQMMAGIFHVPIAAGWLMHLMIGIIFAAGYVFFFNNWLKNITSRTERGAVYGFIAFVIGQIGFSMLDAFFNTEPSPPLESSVALLLIVSTVNHIVFGMVVSLFVKPRVSFTKNIIK
jgi:hypothetical protein